MKYLISIMLCFGFVFCKGQKDTSSTGLTSCDTCIIFSAGETGTTYGDSISSVTKWSDGRFEITGDTLHAIKLLWKRLEEANNNESDLYDFVGAAVDFTNHVPDYWKSSKGNKAWLRYKKALIKQGFKVIKQ